jgi:hypothetical protein
MAKSLKDILMMPVDTDLSAEGFRRAFGISDYLGKSRAAKRTKAAAEDMSKRITEKSNAGPGVKPKTVKVTKKEVSVETPTGNIGAASGEIGPDMGRINREAPVIDMSTQASPEDVARIKGEDRVDMHEQARRMMGFKKGGAVKKRAGGCGMKKGGAVKASGASKRADGCAQRGKTRGRMV